MKKLLPIGISDYKKIREDNFYYVDKTLLIKEVYDSGIVVLLTRPRRFGKTLHLSMIDYFFSLSDQDHSTLFKDTNIWKDPKFHSLQGTLPVIFVSFREISQVNYQAMINKFAYVIAREFDRHAYLAQSALLEDFEKEKFNRLRTETATETDLGGSLEFLLRMLNKHHNKTVMVLIDEYDVPIQYAFLNNFYDKIIPFMRELLTGALKDQKLLEKGVVTGNLALAQAGIFTGLNNLDIFNLTSEKTADKFGFTTQEVKDMLDYYGLAETYTDAEKWYNGYRFGSTSGMFNPWSVIKYVSRNGYLDTYWVNTSDNILLKMLIASASESIKSDFQLLLQDQSVDQQIVESIIFPEIKQNNTLVWSLLLFSGYLTYTQSVMKNNKREWSLIIPNIEIKQLLSNLIADVIEQSVAGGNVNTLFESMFKGNVEIFSSLLQSFVMSSMSTFDITSDEPEKSYHLFILGLLVNVSATYEVKSNRESGLGRYDIVLIPKNKQQPAVIIEFKKVWSYSKETLESAAEKALNQIIEKNYIQELKSREIEQVVAYGIAFEKKELFIVCKKFMSGKEEPCMIN